MIDDDVRAIQTAFPQIYRACHRVHKRRRSSALAVSERDAAILAHLDADGAMTPGELARHLSVAASTLSAALTRLAGLGLLHMTRGGADRRRVQLTLTARGGEAVAAGSVLDTARLHAALMAVTPARRAVMVRGLTLLAAATRALRAHAGAAS